MYARTKITKLNQRVVGPSTVYASSSKSYNDVELGTNAGLGYCRLAEIGNAVCDAGAGWDGPTGRGTPKGLAPFAGGITP